eukprot:scaffold3953_cov236-Pinguiococcus_pyrenoidosus.AAC.1
MAVTVLDCAGERRAREDRRTDAEPAAEANPPATRPPAQPEDSRQSRCFVEPKRYSEVRFMHARGDRRTAQCTSPVQ